MYDHTGISPLYPSLQPSSGAGLYIDVENLHTDGQHLVQGLLENWPASAPSPSRLTLYVRADQVELWRLWATSRFTELDVVVYGTQHFSLSSSKNSADIAIATNAMADLTLKRVNYVVVFSDDSDFISLYIAIRDDPDIPRVDGRAPFLWVVTDREGPLSAMVKRFFPPDVLHVATARRNHDPHPVAPGPAPAPALVRPREVPPPRPDVSRGILWADMAQAVLRDVPVGPFKSIDCQPVIKEHWPAHPLGQAGAAAFGTDFKNNIWPILESLGVKIGNPGKKPVRYEMTNEAKATLG